MLSSTALGPGFVIGSGPSGLMGDRNERGVRSFVAVVTLVVVAIGVAALWTTIRVAIANAFAVDHTTFPGHKQLVGLVAYLADLELRVKTFLFPLLVQVSTFSLWFQFYAR